MKKILLLLCFQPLLVGCPQEQYNFFVDFHNVCNSPVRVVAHHYTNTDKPFEIAMLTQQLDVNETLTVLKTWGFSKTPEYGVPPIYKLEIYVDDKKRDFDKSAFLEVLKKSKLESSNGLYTWTISDPSLCPTSRNKVESLFEKEDRYNKALHIFGQLLMMMAYAREYGISDGNGKDDLSKMAYILDEINENKELINLITNGFWLAQEDKKDESLAKFDEIYKRFSKDKRATAHDAAVISRLYKHEDMSREGKADEAQAIMDELSREFDMNDQGIQMLLKLIKTQR